MPRIFHIALESDWLAARRSGQYTTSTLGRTLAEEGFIHASRADQWQRVHEQHYAGVTEPLLLLIIDPDLLDVPVVEERPPGTDETFPHIYGPLDPAAVLQTVPLPVALAGRGESFGTIFLREMMRNAALGLLLLGLVLAGVLLGYGLSPPYGAWAGLLLGLVAGVLAIRHLNRRRG